MGGERGVNPVAARRGTGSRDLRASSRGGIASRVALALAPDRDPSLRADLLGASQPGSGSGRHDGETRSRPRHSLLETIPVKRADARTSPDAAHRHAARTARDGVSRTRSCRHSRACADLRLERAVARRADSSDRASTSLASIGRPTRQRHQHAGLGQARSPCGGHVADRRHGDRRRRGDARAARADTGGDGPAPSSWRDAWRRPPSVLRALDCLVTDLVWRHGLFREGATQAAEYESTAVVTALIATEWPRSSSRREPAPRSATSPRPTMPSQRQSTPRRHWRTRPSSRIRCLAGPPRAEPLPRRRWPEYRAAIRTWLAQGQREQRSVRRPHARTRREVRWAAKPRPERPSPALLDACAHQPPLTLYRDAALATTLAAAWELGGAEHAASRSVAHRSGGRGGSRAADRGQPAAGAGADAGPGRRRGRRPGRVRRTNGRSSTARVCVR